jgi:hypothetical protein
VAYYFQKRQQRGLFKELLNILKNKNKVMKKIVIGIVVVIVGGFFLFMSNIYYKTEVFVKPTMKEIRNFMADEYGWRVADYQLGVITKEEFQVYQNKLDSLKTIVAKNTDPITYNKLMGSLPY